ncbi:MAG: toll/interleukin-1 receptor domain-containing protein [Candidatus Acidiferrales bacterium]
METGGSKQGPVEVFVAYSHVDEPLRDELGKHLKPLEREGVICVWHDRRIGAGTDFGAGIDQHLGSCRLVLLLISADFISSDYCYGKEMTRALERHDAQSARVIPVILRPADWEQMPFAKLLALPTDGKPITTWDNRDKAFLDVARGIRRAVNEVRGSSPTLNTPATSESQPAPPVVNLSASDVGRKILRLCNVAGQIPALSVRPTIPRKAETDRFIVERIESDVLVLRKSSGHQVQVSVSRIDDVIPGSPGYPPTLLLKGRLQFITERGWDFFTDGPTPGSELGFPKIATMQDPRVNEVMSRLRGWKFYWATEDKLPVYLAGGWEVFYDGDGLYFRIRDPWGDLVLIAQRPNTVRPT